MHYFGLNQAQEEAFAVRWLGVSWKAEILLTDSQIYILNCSFLRLNKWHYLGNKRVQVGYYAEKMKAGPIQNQDSWNKESEARAVTLEGSSNCWG